MDPHSDKTFLVRKVFVVVLVWFLLSLSVRASVSLCYVFMSVLCNTNVT
jgi:hypothetical protein